MKHIKIEADGVTLQISESDRVLFITGAGISVDSGLPTYRGKGGLYTDKEGEIEGLLSASNMEHKPGLIWDAITPLLKDYSSYEPNIGHKTIAKIQEFVKDSCVFTQQVDNLHQKAGSENVIDIHGNLSTAYCKNCINVRGKEKAYISINDVDFGVKTKRKAPACSFCKSDLRPNIVPFNGMLDMSKISALEEFLKEPVSHVFIVGTSLQFPYMVAPIQFCHKNYDAKVIFIEPSDDFNLLDADGIPNFWVKKESSAFFKDCVKW